MGGILIILSLFGQELTGEPVQVIYSLEFRIHGADHSGLIKQECCRELQNAVGGTDVCLEVQ